MNYTISYILMNELNNLLYSDELTIQSLIFLWMNCTISYIMMNELYILMNEQYNLLYSDE